MPIRFSTALLALLIFLCHCENQHSYLEKPSGTDPQQTDPTVPPNIQSQEEPNPRNINRKVFTGEKPLEAFAFFGPKLNQRYVELKVNYKFFQKGEISHVNILRADGEREPEIRGLLRPHESYFGDEEVKPLKIYNYHVEVVYSDDAKDVSPRAKVFTPPHDTFDRKPVTGPHFLNGYNGFGRVYFEKNVEAFTRGKSFTISDVSELHIDEELRINTGSASAPEALPGDSDYGLIWIEVNRIVGGTLIFEGTGLGGNQGPNTPPIFVRVRNPENRHIIDRTQPAEGGKKLPVCFVFAEELVGNCDPATWEPYGITLDVPTPKPLDHRIVQP